MSDLLPCPHCGSDRITVWNIRDGQQAVCKDCKSTGTPIFHGPDGHTATRGHAVAAWNRRASLAPAVGSPMEAVGWRMRDNPEDDWMTAYHGGKIDEKWVEAVGFAIVEPLYAAPASPDVDLVEAPQLETTPAAFEVLDHVRGTYVTRSEQAALNTEFPYNGLYRRKGALT